MTTLLDEMVITEGNKEAFEAILSIGRSHPEAQRLFIWGPAGSGKSSEAYARGREKDLLSTRRIISCHSQEVMASLKSGVNDGFLDEIGEVDILLLDGFESLFAAPDIGPSLARLLLSARNAKGLSTVVISDVPMAEVDGPELEGALDGFRQISVEPLDGSGWVEFARRVQDTVRGSRDSAPVLSDDALAFIANGFAQGPDDIRNAVRYLLTQTEEPAGSELKAERVRELLGVS